MTGVLAKMSGSMRFDAQRSDIGKSVEALHDHKLTSSSIGKDAIDHTEVEVESPNSHPSVRRVAHPAAGSLAKLYEGADVADSYAICLPASASRDSIKMARLLFERLPMWFRALMILRNLIVVWFGIQSFRRLHQPGRVRRITHIGCYHIYSYSPSNIVIGRDDTHLDFRIAILLRRSKAGAKGEMVVTTMMRCHNSFGQRFLKAILLFHAMVVRSNLRRAAASEWEEQHYFAQKHSSWLKDGLMRTLLAIDEWVEDRNIFIPHYRFGGSTCTACRADNSRAVNKIKDGSVDDERFYPPFRELYPRVEDHSASGDSDCTSLEWRVQILPPQPARRDGAKSVRRSHQGTLDVRACAQQQLKEELGLGPPRGPIADRVTSPRHTELARELGCRISSPDPSSSASLVH